jgi:hypothetical protein
MTGNQDDKGDHDHEYDDGGDPRHDGCNGNHHHDLGGSQCGSPGGLGEFGNQGRGGNST